MTKSKVLTKDVDFRNYDLEMYLGGMGFKLRLLTGLSIIFYRTFELTAKWRAVPKYEVPKLPKKSSK